MAARAAFDAADHDRALQLIDAAEELDPAAAQNWARIRGIIAAARPAPAAPAAAGTPPSPGETPTAEPQFDLTELQRARERANSLTHQARHSQAATVLAAAVAPAAQAFGAVAPQVLQLRLELAEAQFTAGDYTGAGPVFRDLASDLAEAQDADTDLVWRCRRQAATCRALTGDTGDAIRQLTALMTEHHARYGTDDEVQELREQLRLLGVEVEIGRQVTVEAGPAAEPSTSNPPAPDAATAVPTAPAAAVHVPAPGSGDDAGQRPPTSAATVSSEAAAPAPPVLEIGAEPTTEAERTAAAVPTGRPPTNESSVAVPAPPHAEPTASVADPDPHPGPSVSAAAQFRAATQDQLAPSGSLARVRANIAALQTLRAPRDGRPFTADEQAVLARWSGWGAVPEVFDPLREDLAWARAQLADLLDPQEMKAAARNTLNAHYTDLGLVAPIWSALQQLGFREGRVLEPGCGSGNFIGAAPAGAQMVGVEVEPVTAAIAAALYPNAEIRSESFAQTRAPAGSFDMVVGNVPFGKVVLADRDYNAPGHSIHNHFILRSLQLTAPGGLVALITSRYTMDAANPAARREMAQLADLVAAIRLPQDAHQRAAGTHVVTDLLIFRRREDDYEPDANSPGWELTELVDLDGKQVRINSYFAARPEMVCGHLAVTRGQFSDADLTVVADAPAADLLTERLTATVEEARARGLLHAPSAPAATRPAAYVPADAHVADGHIHHDGTQFVQASNGQYIPFAVPKTQEPELHALLELRDTAVRLLEAEAASLDYTAELDELRQQLNTTYDAYLAQYGPLNRFTWRRTGRTNPETNEPVMARIAPPQGKFRSDPAAPVVYALEHFDPTTQHATKADIFTQRVVAPRTPQLGADTAEDALAICLDTHGRVDLTEIARLLGLDDQQARAALGSLVFEDPAQDDKLVPSAEYLSGQVREKLAIARAAATDDPRFETNVAALIAVVPADLAPEDIVARLGASWIDVRYVQQFLRELLDDSHLTVEHPYGSNWKVDGDCYGITATSTWGTEDYAAPKLAEALLEQRPIVVQDEVEVPVPGGGTTTRRITNLAKTVAAQGKADEIAERFSEWVWEDPQRATELARVYNDRFNSLVLRSYDDVKLTLPGLALSFEPRPHQIAAVARMIHEPAVGLYHEVGAGKTAEMAMGVMELRRLGMVRKPAVVVPNHMLEQFAREFQQLYPRAKLLAASSADLVKDKRRAFVARVTTGDWDAVIMTRTAFERIAMSPTAQADYLDAQLSELREALERQRSEGQQGRRNTLKQLETRLLNAEEKIKERLAKDYDPAVTFEQTGIDYVVVDEAHDFKNLHTASRIPSAAIEGSNRAADLEMKMHYLRRRHGLRVGTFATATPIANSITEAHVMQRYLRPDLLEAAGVLDFDTWAATFGQTTAEIEISPDGGTPRLKARFAKFHNVPELLRMWWVSGDVKTAEDLNLPRPELFARPEDGKRLPQTVIVPASAELVGFMSELAERAERVRSRAVRPQQDNMLLISSHGRAAALDMRLVGHPMTPGESKLEAAADTIADIWRKHRDDRFHRRDGTAHPTPGGFQIVFCDLSTPKPDEWNAYDELRALLATRGLPEERVRFIHEARNDREKAELFEACRNGEVAVLIGSTGKMGVGTNVQARAIALHHLDCPWRPADLAQRDGRALRQGNAYAEIGIYRYVTEGSFDAYSWQTVARKASFIAQVMRGRLDLREIEDIGDAALSFNEVKALAAGNPLLLDKAKADAELTRLERLERAHQQSKGRLRFTIDGYRRGIERLAAEIAALTTAIDARRDTRGEAFSMRVDGQTFTDRADAGKALTDRLLLALSNTAAGSERTLRGVAELGGLSFDATLHNDRLHTGYELQISGLQGSPVTGSRTQLLESKPHGLAVRMENRLASLDKARTDAESAVQCAHEEIARAEAQLDAPFPHAAALEEARHVARDLDRQMAEWAAAQDQTSDSPSTAATEPAVPETAGIDQRHPAARASAALMPPSSISRNPRPGAGQLLTSDSSSPLSAIPAPQTACSRRRQEPRSPVPRK
ncbi:DEAD/DEAH box helicase family protein [Pseudonocardia dioxanivorans]|uniref:DEAD/DEAH box helicase family protein n=1 Tax=Pseudonocardia dioxanivorans TaxID=240495 RepID=UPI0015E83661|nr:SNF2-related protein [Pseudonocardia dioxanivorans]